jgi:hypothetical protein
MNIINVDFINMSLGMHSFYGLCVKLRFSILTEGERILLRVYHK